MHLHQHIWKEIARDMLREEYVERDWLHFVIDTYYAITQKCVVCGRSRIIESRKRAI